MFICNINFDKIISESKMLINDFFKYSSIKSLPNYVRFLRLFLALAVISRLFFVGFRNLDLFLYIRVLFGNFSNALSVANSLAVLKNLTHRLLKQNNSSIRKIHLSIFSLFQLQI